jgi:formyl-CoA transferase
VPGIIPRLSGNPGAIHARGPTLGEHTDAVLGQAGLTAEDITALKAKGIVS